MIVDTTSIDPNYAETCDQEGELVANMDYLSSQLRRLTLLS